MNQKTIVVIIEENVHTYSKLKKSVYEGDASELVSIYYMGYYYQIEGSNKLSKAS